MGKLAIRGHATRGKEVIEILEMLGGNNPHKYVAYIDRFYFYIGDETRNIYYDWFYNYNFDGKDVTIFTLEEFIEKFPYRVGDKVKCARINDFIGRVINVRWDENENQIIYVVEWDDATKSTLTYFANGLQPYKEETMEKEKNDWAKWDLPEGYEFQDNEGNVINTDVIKLVKKQPHYPKNFKECCEVLGCKANHFFTNFSYNGCDVEISEYEDKVDDLVQNFRKLRYARDAYWKIAGEQMGLGKPWKPDWKECRQPPHCIFVEIDNFKHLSHILAFPTEEIRDTFFENFGYLIEICKELL